MLDVGRKFEGFQPGNAGLVLAARCAKAVKSFPSFPTVHSMTYSNHIKRADLDQFPLFDPRDCDFNAFPVGRFSFALLFPLSGCVCAQ